MQSGNDAAAPYSTWEFVHCGVCYLPFINPRKPDGPPHIPFWLMECSHIVCNNHLNADQTCRQCGDGKRIEEIMPLQLDLPNHMSKWFRSLPDAIHGLELASKIQHETMARLIRFYKTKCTSQKELIERLRREVDALKTQASQARQDRDIVNASQSDTGYEPFNSNGKRRRIEVDTQESQAFRHDNHQQYRSPSSDTGYHGLSRLTLRPGSSRTEQEQGRSYVSDTSADQPTFRQGGNSGYINLGDFAYQPTDREDGRVGTARALTSSFNGAGSNGPSPYQPVAAPTNFTAGPQQIDKTFQLPNLAHRERFKPPSSMQSGPGDEFSNERSATRYRFSSAQVSTPIPTHRINQGSKAGPATPSLNTRALNTVSAASSKRFVPPSPSGQNSNQTLMSRGQQQRTRSQLQMPPPPMPGNGNSGFR